MTTIPDLTYERIERATVILPLEYYERYRLNARSKGWQLIHCHAAKNANVRVVLEKVVFKKVVPGDTNLAMMARME